MSDPGLTAIEYLKRERSAYEWTQDSLRSIQCSANGFTARIWAELPTVRNRTTYSRLQTRIKLADAYPLTRSNLRALSQRNRLATTSGLIVGLEARPNLYLAQTRYVCSRKFDGNLLAFQRDEILGDAQIIARMLRLALGLPPPIGGASPNITRGIGDAEVRKSDLRGKFLAGAAKSLKEKGQDSVIYDKISLNAELEFGDQEFYFSLTTDHAHPERGPGISSQLYFPTLRVEDAEKTALALNQAEVSRNTRHDFQGSWISHPDGMAFVCFHSDESLRNGDFAHELVESMTRRAEWVEKDVLRGGILAEEARFLKSQNRSFKPKQLLEALAERYVEDVCRDRAIFVFKTESQFYHDLVEKKEVSIKLNLEYPDDDLRRAINSRLSAARLLYKRLSGNDLETKGVSRAIQIYDVDYRKHNNKVDPKETIWHEICISIALFFCLKDKLPFSSIADRLSKKPFTDVFPEGVTSRLTDKYLKRICERVRPSYDLSQIGSLCEYALMLSMAMKPTADSFKNDSDRKYYEEKYQAYIVGLTELKNMTAPKTP